MMMEAVIVVLILLSESCCGFLICGLSLSLSAISGTREAWRGKGPPAASLRSQFRVPRTTQGAASGERHASGDTKHNETTRQPQKRSQYSFPLHDVYLCQPEPHSACRDARFPTLAFAQHECHQSCRRNTEPSHVWLYSTSRAARKQVKGKHNKKYTSIRSSLSYEDYPHLTFSRAAGEV